MLVKLLFKVIVLLGDHVHILHMHVGAVLFKVIVLWGDHGWQLGEHSEWCKHTNFDVRFRILDVQN